MPTGGPLLVSAPGKVILHGEHAVVYGKPALASSVGLRCYTLLVPSEAPTVTLDLPTLSVSKCWPLSELALPTAGEGEERLRELAGVKEGVSSTDSMACLAFLYLLTHICGDKLRETGGLAVTVVATLPAGAGLGSSAAYSVCLAAGLLTHTHTIGQLSPSEVGTSCGELPEPLPSRLRACGVWSGPGRGWSKSERDLINKWGYQAERLIHGQPSGIDNSISTFGGAIHFQSGEISPLESMPRLRMLLVDTQVPRSTKKMVAGVRQKYDKFPAVVSAIFDAVEAIVNSAMELLSSNQSHESHVTESLQELFALNHHLLNSVGVGHPRLDQVCDLLAGYGLRGKLTGGGGGGCAIALLPSDMSDERVCEVRGVLREAGCVSWCTEVGAPGVCLHSLTTQPSTE